ncbi:MAG: hypothetical protein VYD39_01455, partial [Bacteroidota bacterium]|nr:hypothetical protein [Bacteroidota bacterium]
MNTGIPIQENTTANQDNNGTQNQQQMATNTWNWDMITINNMKKIFHPCLQLQNEMHAQLKSKILTTQKKIDLQAPSPTKRILAHIFLLQAIHCHPTQPTYKKKRIVQHRRLAMFNKGNWDQLFVDLQERINQISSYRLSTKAHIYERDRLLNTCHIKD